MAQVVPETPSVAYVQPSRSRQHPGSIAGLALVFVGFFVFMFGTVVAAVTEIVHPVLMALLGFGLLFAGGIVFALSNESESPRVPPPPAMGPPDAPAEARGAIEIPCPNCGASPKAVDRFGVATCGYCGTRFLIH